MATYSSCEKSFDQAKDIAMKVILTYGLVLILNLFLLGCQKEEAFTAGWDEFIVDTW